MHATIYEHDTWHIHVSEHAMKIEIETLQHITLELVRLVSALALVFPTTSNCSTRQWNKGTVNIIIMSILMRSRQCKKYCYLHGLKVWRKTTEKKAHFKITLACDFR